MLCLGIESSCDDSALALVEDGRILGQALHSQIDVHALFGGVVPELASREHGRLFPRLYDSLFRQTGVSPRSIDCIAVTRGPGLLGSLLVGVSFAKALAWALHRPLIAVNHLHAHLLAAGLEHEIVYPALGLLVSGGHTHIYRMDGPGAFTQLGVSIDDAAGEALDKFGKVLGLPYPAGKYVDEFGKNGVVDEHLFPRPYLDNDNCDFSFSGLKTAAAQLLGPQVSLRFSKDAHSLQPTWSGFPETDRRLADLCASYTEAVAETLRIKCERALRQHAESGLSWGSLVLAGGVAANSRVRSSMKRLAERFELPLVVPSPSLCTDNAIMVAHAGALLYGMGRVSELSFAAVPRGQQVPDDYVSKVR